MNKLIHPKAELPPGQAWLSAFLQLALSCFIFVFYGEMSLLCINYLYKNIGGTYRNI